MENTEDLRKTYRPARLMAVVMLGSLVVYVVLALVLKASRPFQRPMLRGNTVNVVRMSAYGFAILQVIFIRLVRGVSYRKSPGLEVGGLGRRLMLVSIFTSVASEVPALLGFILFLLTGLTWDLYILVFVSLVLMFMFFPRFQYWEGWVAEQRSLPVERS